MPPHLALGGPRSPWGETWEAVVPAAPWPVRSGVILVTFPGKEGPGLKRRSSARLPGGLAGCPWETLRERGRKPQAHEMGFVTVITYR